MPDVFSAILPGLFLLFTDVNMHGCKRIGKLIARPVYSAFSLAFIFLIALPVCATEDISQLMELSLRELIDIKVQSSTFFDRPTTQSPGYSWIMTQPEIERAAVVYVKDLFDYYAPATTVSQTHFAGATTGVRGIATSNNSKSIFMVNGQSLNQKSHYGYQAGLESALFGDFSRIEVINGPGTMLHGSGAINGIVNVISKNGRDNPGFHSSVVNGSKEGLRKFDLGYGGQYGADNSYYLYAGVAQADGFRPESYLEAGDRHSSDLDPTLDQEFKVYQLEDNYRLASYIVHNDLEFQAQFQRVERSLNGTVVRNEPTSNRRHWQNLLALRWKYHLQLADDTRIVFSLPIEFFDHGINFNDNPDEGDKAGRENHAALITTLYHVSGQHMFAFGGSAEHRDFDPKKQYFESDKPKLEESMDAHLIESAVFAEDIWALSDQLSLVLGVRYDYVEYSELFDPESGVSIAVDDLSAFTKRFAINRQLDAKNTIKMSYQEGFRYPDISYYLYLGIINDALAAAGEEKLPTLKEETVKSYELNFLHEMSSVPMSWDFNLYYNIHKGTLDWKDYDQASLGATRFAIAQSAIGFGPGSFANAVDEYNALGGEIVSHWRPSADTHIRWSYGYSRPSGFDRDDNKNLELVNASGDEWASYPEHLFKLAINHRLFQNLRFNLTGYYASSVDICISNCGAAQTRAEKFHQQDRVRVNGKLIYSYNTELSFSLTAMNIFEDDGPAVGNASRGGTGALGGLGDDSRRLYISADLSL